MSLIILQACGVIAALVFASMMAAIARHRAGRTPAGRLNPTALSEFSWAAVPWVIMLGSVWPSVRLIVAGSM